MKTPKLGLELPPFESGRWDIPNNNNFEILDGSYNSIIELNKILKQSNNIKDVFIYDTSKDSDGGEWINKCNNLSWYNEPLNTAIRGRKRQFPAIAAIVLESAHLTIYDMTEPDCPMWMFFEGHYQNMVRANLTCCEMVDSVLCLGYSDTGVGFLNFTSEKSYKYQTYSTQSRFYNGLIADRNNKKTETVFNGFAILNFNIIDLTIKKGDTFAEPVVCIATVLGVNIIRNLSEQVSLTWTSKLACFHISFDYSGYLSIIHGDEITSCIFAHKWKELPESDLIEGEGFEKGTSDFFYCAGYDSTYTGVDLVLLSSFDLAGTYIKAIDKTFYGNGFGITVIDDDNEVSSLGMVNYITSNYQSGWMQGDIKGAWLSDTTEGALTNGVSPDRSINNTPLNVIGTNIVKTKVNGNSELVGYSGFSADDYFIQNYSDNIDFSTGDFCFMFWVKTIGTGNEYLVSIDEGTTNSSNRLLIYMSSGIMHLMTGTIKVDADRSIIARGWNFVTAIRKNGELNLFINGKKQTLVANSTTDITNNLHSLYVGNRIDVDQFLTGSISLLRMGKTAPTNEQIKKIYEDEKSLFYVDAKCTIQNGSSNVSCVSNNGCSFVGTNTGLTKFNGVTSQNVDNFQGSDNHLIYVSNNKNEYLAATQKEAVIYTPAISLKEELKRLEAQNKHLQEQVDGLTGNELFADFYSGTNTVYNVSVDLYAVYVDGLLINPANYTYDGETLTLSVAPATECCIMYFKGIPISGS